MAKKCSVVCCVLFVPKGLCTSIIKTKKLSCPIPWIYCSCLNHLKTDSVIFEAMLELKFTGPYMSKVINSQHLACKWPLVCKENIDCYVTLSMMKLCSHLSKLNTASLHYAVHDKGSLWFGGHICPNRRVHIYLSLKPLLCKQYRPCILNSRCAYVWCYFCMLALFIYLLSCFVAMKPFDPAFNIWGPYMSNYFWHVFCILYLSNPCYLIREV